MNKSELIKLLEPLPDDTQIFLYLSDSEDMEPLNSAELETEENQKYCKGDHPFDYLEEFKDNKVAIVLMS